MRIGAKIKGFCSEQIFFSETLFFLYPVTVLKTSHSVKFLNILIYDRFQRRG